MNKKKRNELNIIFQRMKIENVSFDIARQMVRKGYVGVWKENGVFMQKCSYEFYGTCRYPCNGDC